MSFQTLVRVRTSGDGVIDRRTFLRSTAALAAGGMLGFKDALTVHADEMRKKGMSCILVFLRGGPSQFETFDPKPGTTNGGPTKAIDTAVKGIQVAEHWPTVAKAMKEICLVRSMNNREGEHQRATYQMQTGYAPAGGIKHPAFGALVAKEIAPKEFDLPHFVSIGGRGGGLTSSFLGMRFSPYVVFNPGQIPANVSLPSGVSESRLTKRVNLLRELEEDFAKDNKKLVEEHQALEESATKMVRSPKIEAFDLSKEKAAVRDKYGRSTVGQGCLLARRLVETGVTFVTIDSNGWDTHQDNFDNVKRLSGTVDPGLGTLVEDLKERGLLEKTLVVCLGEFGRTPRINANKGRDHWPRSFSVLLAGGGVKGGQVIGSTSADGTSIKERPVGVADLFVSFCEALKIDPRKENLSTEGRPLKIVDGGKVVKELF
jgi:uncharacterized protein (DUF1501 family)